ncbi:hypothetical protein JCM3765_004976 [Sporobolomyces pararoseus]
MLRSSSRSLPLLRKGSTTTTTTKRYSSTRSTVELLSDLNQLLQQPPQHQPLLAEGLVSQTWLNRLNLAIKDLQSGKRNSRISIVGDLESGVQKLSNSILDDPLSNSGQESQQDVTVALETRSLTQPPPEQSTLSYEQIEAKWLKNHQTSLNEIIITRESIPPLLQSSFNTLHLSDSIILLISPTKLLSSSAIRQILQELNSKPNLIICVNTPPDATTATSSETILKTLQNELDTLFPTDSSRIVMTISTEQALKALNQLNSTTSQFDETSYLSSRIPELKSLLSEILSRSRKDLQETTSLYILEKSLSKTFYNLINLKDTLFEAKSNLKALSLKLDESSNKLLSKSFKIDSQSSSSSLLPGMFPLPELEVLSSKQEIEKVFKKRLQFYKLPFNKIDDISSELSLTISTTFLTNFEKDLIYLNTLLESYSNQLNSKIFDEFLSKPPFSENSKSSILYSPLIENEISKSFKSFKIPSQTALTTPLSLRRNQLISSPLSQLHRSTQKALTNSIIFSTTTILSSLGMNWLEWIDFNNSIGLAVLGIVVGIWKFQGKWEKFKKVFMKEIDRLNKGISEDLGVVTKKLIERCEYPTRLMIKSYESKIKQQEIYLKSFEKSLKEIEKESKEIRRRLNGEKGGGRGGTQE